MIVFAAPWPMLQVAGPIGHVCSLHPDRRVHALGIAAAGVKVLLAGEQQAAVTVAVEALMDGKPSPELDSFATFDPKARCHHNTVCLHADLAVALKEGHRG